MREEGMSVLNVEDQARLNALVREYAGNPDSVEERRWKIWRESENGCFWYIPEADEIPGDDNIVEGNTGAMIYVDKEDAYAEWCGVNPGAEYEGGEPCFSDECPVLWCGRRLMGSAD